MLWDNLIDFNKQYRFETELEVYANAMFCSVVSLSLGCYIDTDVSEEANDCHKGQSPIARLQGI